MLATAQGRRYLVLCLLPLACGDDSAAKKPPEKYDCVVTHSTLGKSPRVTQRWRVTWNEDTRVKAQLTSEDPDSEVRLAWRYYPDGRLRAYAGYGRFDNSQRNFAYDQHHHVVDAYVSSPPHPELESPPAMDTDPGTTYSNEYGDAGELTASTRSMRGKPGLNSVRYDFRQDGLRHCRQITITGGPLESTETRSYDDADRLVTSEIEYSRPLGTNMSCPERITTHEYDELFRITRSRTHCRDTPQLDALLIVHSYARDGSETIETFDYTDDVVNDSITIDGVEYHFAHRKEQRTAGCAEIEAEITRRTDYACRMP